MTKSGVEWDLSKSPYRLTLEYSNGNVIIFVFSSATVKANFEANYKKNREEIRSSLSNRFRINMILSNDLYDLSLYRKLERRGFLINYNGHDIEWIGSIQYKSDGLDLK